MFRCFPCLPLHKKDKNTESSAIQIVIENDLKTELERKNSFTLTANGLHRKTGSLSKTALSARLKALDLIDSNGSDPNFPATPPPTPQSSSNNLVELGARSQPRESSVSQHEPVPLEVMTAAAGLTETTPEPPAPPTRTEVAKKVAKFAGPAPVIQTRTYELKRVAKPAARAPMIMSTPVHSSDKCEAPLEVSS
mmetsp:Transcript_4852/g.7565  ORF Transcript_4852/g.7565 Transcript_4852/m.7565 type:complete len:194 (+) Transcript_4852:204-785(+)